jgi:hypothetical protein
MTLWCHYAVIIQQIDSQHDDVQSNGTHHIDTELNVQSA